MLPKLSCIKVLKFMIIEIGLYKVPFRKYTIFNEKVLQMINTVAPRLYFNSGTFEIVVDVRESNLFLTFVSFQAILCFYKQTNKLAQDVPKIIRP